MPARLHRREREITRGYHDVLDPYVAKGALKIVVEPSSAVPYAAIREGKVDVAGKAVGIILTGGNVDLDKLPWVAEGTQ